MKLPILQPEDLVTTAYRRQVVLIGNPNAGKTTLFNALTGLRATTANYPGTTVEHRRGTFALGDLSVTLLDLPGLYDLSSTTPEEEISRQVLQGTLPGQAPPDLIVLVLDATHLQRNLFLVSQVLELQRPTLVAMNMTDVAEAHDIRVNLPLLAESLQCEVVPIAARTGRNLDQLRQAMRRALGPSNPGIQSEPSRSGIPCQPSCAGCSHAKRHAWAEQISSQAVDAVSSARQLQRSMAIDRIAIHPWGGFICFALVMLLTFLLISWLAQWPMNFIEGLFAEVANQIAPYLPEGDIRSLVTHGLIGGVGGVVVFLPQICVLFFFLSLLEDSGYLARAALVMDRLMRCVGLPGKAFVPLLSAHACAIPAIMASRVIDNRRDRLLSILILPLASCSARIPVYAMLTALLFPNRPWAAAAAFTGANFLGIASALAVAWCLRHTLLPGNAQPLMIELPNYRWPSLRNACIVTWDRAWSFLRNAGTVILAISVILWGLARYPQVSPEGLQPQHQAELATLQAAVAQAAAAASDTPAAPSDHDRPADPLGEQPPTLAQQELDRWWQQTRLEYSWAGRLGKAIQPIFSPLGFDWKMSVGVVTSFAAREVVVTTLSVLYGMGEDASDQGGEFYAALSRTTRPDGTPVFQPAACWSLLVFYVLAMQCLPTQAVTRRETGSWKWALFQLVYMTLLAYGASLLTYQIGSRW